MKRVERMVFQAIVMSEDQSKDNVYRLATIERFKHKRPMVGDVCRVSMKSLSANASVFTAIEVYDVDSLSLLQRMRHLLCKFRAAALRKMGFGEAVVVVISDTGF